MPVIFKIAWYVLTRAEMSDLSRCFRGNTNMYALIRAIRVFMTVIPAQAGIQTGVISADVGPRLRGDDGNDTVNHHANRSKRTPVAPDGNRGFSRETRIDR